MSFMALHYQAGSSDIYDDIRNAVSEVVLNSNLALGVERVLDLLEADETYDKATGKARKQLRGTSVVLLEKNVTSTSSLDSVALTE